MKAIVFKIHQFLGECPNCSKVTCLLMSPNCLKSHCRHLWSFKTKCLLKWDLTLNARRKVILMFLFPRTQVDQQLCLRSAEQAYRSIRQATISQTLAWCYSRFIKRVVIHPAPSNAWQPRAQEAYSWCCFFGACSWQQRTSAQWGYTTEYTEGWWTRVAFISQRNPWCIPACGCWHYRRGRQASYEPPSTAPHRISRAPSPSRWGTSTIPLPHWYLLTFGRSSLPGQSERISQKRHSHRGTHTLDRSNISLPKSRTWMSSGWRRFRRSRWISTWDRSVLKRSLWRWLSFR